MPSTTSSSVSSDLASSTVMTPSLPTFFMASARNLPISTSPLAEMVPTWAISSLEVTFFEFFLRSSTMASTARSMPRFRSIGFMPAATDLAPSRTIAWASTVAVVVPSPAWSLVLLATSRSICAPMFSNLSASSISFATVTPSFEMRGAPNDLSSTTLRPLGPSVTFTELARISTPLSKRARASALNFTSLAAIERFSLLNDSHDVGLFEDQEILAVDLDFGAGPLAEQHAVADLDVRRNELAARVPCTGTHRHDLALHGLFLGRVRDDDAACGLGLLLDRLEHDTVVQWLEFHCFTLDLWISPRKSISTRPAGVPGGYRASTPKCQSPP